jgi:hypothetical protein
MTVVSSALFYSLLLSSALFCSLLLSSALFCSLLLLGFVILAQQIRPVRRVFINVCHHRAVGLRSPLNKRSKEIPRPCPFIIGAVDENFMDASGKAMVVNIVIPSFVINNVIDDETGDLRDQVSLFSSVCVEEVLLTLFSLVVCFFVCHPLSTLLHSTRFCCLSLLSLSTVVLLFCSLSISSLFFLLVSSLILACY